MLSPEVQFLQALRKHALELRTLAYALPTGWAIHEILQVSDRLIAAADRLAAKKATEQFTAAADKAARQEGAGSHE
jgi:hypothetical protein